MTTYVDVRVNVSDSQINKIKKAVENKEEVSIRLLHADLIGEHVLYVTKTQAAAIEKARANKKGLTLKLSKTAVAHNTKNGGFLGAILSFLATAARTVQPALVGGMAMAGGAKAVDTIDQAVKGRGVKLPKVLYFKKGSAAVKVTRMGEGFHLSPWKSGDSVSGNGVYLKPYGGAGYIDGAGFSLALAQRTHQLQRYLS